MFSVNLVSYQGELIMTTEKTDYEKIKVFVGKHEKGFTTQIRWSAQKSFVEEIMTSDLHDKDDGIIEVRQMIKHSIRINAQAKIKCLMHELTGIKKERNQTECFDVWTPELQKSLDDTMMDWQYDTKPRGIIYLLRSEKKKTQLGNLLASMTEDERADFLSKYA